MDGPAREPPARNPFRRATPLPFAGDCPTPRLPILNIQKGAVGECALDSLTLLLSCGDLHLAQPLPDDARIDRVLFRPGKAGGNAIQIKAPEYLIHGQYMSLRVRAPSAKGALDGFYIFAAHYLEHSPWLSDSFYLIPATFLGPPASGWWRLSLPIAPRRGSKYDRFRHPLTELAAVFSKALDGGPSYPFPPSPAALRRLTPPADGRILENELTNLATVGSDGALHIYRPFSDTGEDLTVADDAHAATLRVQVKGALGPNARGILTAHIQKRTFHESRFNLVAVLMYDVPRLRLSPTGYLFRTDELAALGLKVDADGFYRFEAPASRSTTSKYRPWQYPVEEIPGALATALDVLRHRGPQALVPTRRDLVEAAKRRRSRP